MKQWVMMPTLWIMNKENLGLKAFTPKDSGGAIAALILYIALTHEANDKGAKDAGADDLVGITYSNLSDVTLLSRVMIARGLRMLAQHGLIEILATGKRNIYRILNNSKASGWGKLPKLYFMKNKLFTRFRHRDRNELNALKLYFLFIAFRNNETNVALMGYPKISLYTGIPECNIKAGLSFLVNVNLIHIDRDRDSDIEGLKGNPPSQYRVCGVDPYRHKGTQRAE